MSELVSVTLLKACIFFAIASWTGLIFPWCDLKFILVLSMQVNLWSYSMYTMALRHCIWHQSDCLPAPWLVLLKLTPTTCLLQRFTGGCVSFCGRLLTISVVLIFNSNGLSVPWSLVMLIRSLSWLYASLSLSTASHVSSVVTVRNAKSLCQNGEWVRTVWRWGRGLRLNACRVMLSKSLGVNHETNIAC